MNRYLLLICLLIGFASKARSETPFLNHAPDDNVIENFTNPAPIYDTNKDLYYQIYQKEGAFYQREYRQDQNGNVIHELTRQVTYVIGSGNHNRSYLINENGFLYEMPLTWYSQRKVWDLSPGYQTHNPRFSRPIISDCMNCHNSYTPHQPYSANRYATVPLGIGCIGCITYYQQALQYDPDFITALNNLGNTYLAIVNIAEGSHLFQRVLQLDPNFVPALCNLAVISLRRGQTEIARQYLHRLLKINPGDQRARALLNQIENSR